MQQEISPIAVRPWTLNGISERMIVSHYENNYGGAVRTLNAAPPDVPHPAPGTDAERRAPRARHARAGHGAVPTARAEARGAERDELGGASRALLRQSR